MYCFVLFCLFFFLVFAAEKPFVLTANHSLFTRQTNYFVYKPVCVLDSFFSMLVFIFIHARAIVFIVFCVQQCSV